LKIPRSVSSKLGSGTIKRTSALNHPGIPLPTPTLSRIGTVTLCPFSLCGASIRKIDHQNTGAVLLQEYGCGYALLFEVGCPRLLFEDLGSLKIAVPLPRRGASRSSKMTTAVEVSILPVIFPLVTYQL
jgi:hypothetical protein